MPVYQFGTLNTAALTAPDLYVQIVPPRNLAIPGVPTNILGLVGVASWGPLNAPMNIGSPQDQQQQLGPVTNRKYDLATASSVAFQNYVTAISAIRVSDGTDAAATVTMYDTSATPVSALTVTAKYTGVVGNTITAQFLSGTAANSYKLVIIRQGFAPEIFDNLTGTGNQLYVNAASAVNNGQSGVRGPSTIVVASASTATGTPNVTTVYSLTGGTDGANGVTDATLLGADGATRTGMYALRGTNAFILNLVDHSTSTHWPSILTFAQNIGAYAHGANPVSTSIANSASALATAGVDGYGFKCMVGDWCYWYDSLNGVQRLLSPATFSAARASALAPYRGNLNQPIQGIVATQRTQSGVPYAQSDISAAFQGRLDVITAPSPGGPYFSCRTGLSTSSNPVANDDTYSKMTNFLAYSFAASLGTFVGKPQTPDLRNQVKADIGNFLSGLYQQGQIGDPNNPGEKYAFSVQCDANNNPANRVALGYLQADVKVKYLNTVRFFLVNMEGGGSVTVTVR